MNRLNLSSEIEYTSVKSNSMVGNTDIQYVVVVSSILEFNSGVGKLQVVRHKQKTLPFFCISLPHFYSLAFEININLVEYLV